MFVRNSDGRQFLRRFNGGCVIGNALKGAVFTVTTFEVIWWSFIGEFKCATHRKEFDLRTNPPRRASEGLKSIPPGNQ